MRAIFGLPVPPRHQRPPTQLQPDPNATIIISSDSYGDEQRDPEPAPELPVVDVVDLAESFDELPEINPPQQQQLPVHETPLREAFVLLNRLQEQPPARPLIPPPEPVPEVDWAAVY